MSQDEYQQPLNVDETTIQIAEEDGDRWKKGDLVALVEDEYGQGWVLLKKNSGEEGVDD